MRSLLVVTGILAALAAPAAAVAQSSAPWLRLTDARAGIAVSYPRTWSAQEEPQSALVVVASYRLAAGAAGSPEPARRMPRDSAFISLAVIPARLMAPSQQRGYPPRPVHLTWATATSSTIEGFGIGRSFRFRANDAVVTAQVAFGPHPSARTRAWALRVVAALQLTPLRLRERTIQVGGAPTGIAFARGSAWVALASSLVQLDGASGRVLRRIALPPGGDDRHVAIAGDDAWVTDGAGPRAAVADVDLVAGRVRRSIPIVCCAIGVVVHGDDVWVSVPRDGPGAVMRIDARSGRVRARIPVGPGPGPIAFAGGRVWVWNTSAPTSLMAIDPATDRVTGTADVHGVAAIAAGPAGFWVGGAGIGFVRIDPRSGRILRRTAAVSGTQLLAVGTDAVYGGERSCGACRASFVTRTGLAEGVAGAPLPVGDTAVGLAVGAGALWTADFASGTVTRIPLRRV
jgi:hypothetical protein